MKQLTCLLIGLVVPGLAFGQAGPRMMDDHGHIPLFNAASPGGAQEPGGIAAQPDWIPLGPYGGDVDDVNVSPADANIVLAGIAPNGSSGGTLYRSIDAGDSWTAVAALANQSVFDIEFAPDGTAYIGTLDGVWKSVNGGANWTQLNLNIGVNDQVLEVAINPGNPQEVWAGVAEALGGQTQNVLKSTNGGSSWSNVTPPMGSAMSCAGIAFDPNNTNNVYASFTGSFGGGAFWVSANGGASWTNRSAGLPGNPLVDVAHDGTRVLVTGGQLFGSQNVGLYESTNNGQTWTALHDGSWPVLVCSDIAIDPNDPDIIYLSSLGAGLYRSLDGGDTWTFNVNGTAGLSLNAVRFAPGDATTIYGGGSSIGVIRSTDSGASFQITSVGIGALDVYSVAVNPLDQNEIAIAFQGLNNGGIYSSIDGGQTWNLEAVPGTRWNKVLFNPLGSLYAISDGPTSIAPEGVYRRNFDDTWTSIGPDQGSFFESELYDIRFSLTDPSLIMASGADFGVAGFEPTVWKSTNFGEDWDKVHEGAIPNEQVREIEIVDDGSDTVMVGAFVDFGSDQTGGALRSTDGGETWVPASTGLPAAAQAYTLAKSYDDLNTFFLGDGRNSGGVFVTTDAGANWSVAGYMGNVRDIEADPRDSDTLYLMEFSSTKIKRSRDGGATAEAFNTGLGMAGTGRDIFLADAGIPGLYFATTTGTYVRDLPLFGDLNCDGGVDGADIDAFFLALGDPAAYAAQYPNCDANHGDMNGDGDFDGADIDPFFDCLGNGNCP